VTIARALADHYDEAEMQALAIEFGYEWVNLTGGTHELRAIQFVEAMERRDMLADLVAAMRRDRPRMQIDV
jgi:hypothetical protein